MRNFAHYYLTESELWTQRCDELIGKYRYFGTLESFEYEILDRYCPSWREDVTKG